MIHQKNNKTLIVIAGPTGVGKTSIALKLAARLQCHIFSADSRQIYQELNIGTAKPNQSELESVPHHFINELSITENYNVKKYEEDIISSLNQYYQNHQVAILCGGTGLYIKAALYGLDHIPDIPEELVESLEQKLISHGLDFLTKELMDIDPLSKGQIDLQNPRRVIRALAVVKHTGKPISLFKTGEQRIRNFTPIKILLQRNREELYNRINERVLEMLEEGLLEEVRKLHTFKDLPSMQTVGYQELISYLDGKVEYEEAVRLIKRNSRRYAKRQITWFNNQDTWKVFHPDEENNILSYITSQL
jgi:tRNA dimethylallyltransferase